MRHIKYISTIRGEAEYVPYEGIKGGIELKCDVIHYVPFLFLATTLHGSSNQFIQEAIAPLVEP